jgi:hypothetical protein
MGREVRRVPPDWDHEKYSSKPLGDRFGKALTDWIKGYSEWRKGYRYSHLVEEWIPIEQEYKQYPYTDFVGDRPDPNDYMPDWNESDRTHYQVYENVTEGTPISPVFATEEEMIDWLVQNESGAREYWVNAIKTGIY